MLDAITSRLDDALRRFGDSLEATLLFSGLRREIYFLVSRSGSQRTIEAATPLRSEVKLTIGRQVQVAASDPSRLARHARSAFEDERDSGWRRIEKGDATVQTNGNQLVISSTSGTAEPVARSLLASDLRPYAPRRRLDGIVPAATRFWSVGALAMIAVSLISALLAVTTITVCCFAVAIGLVVAGTTLAGRRDGVLARDVLVGLAVPILIAAFAVIYGLAMTGKHPALALHAKPHIVDPVMLSFGVATTAGFLDFSLNQEWVRWLAYLEMTLVVSVAGASVYSLGRTAWSALTEFMRPRG